jgi:hypothetical protein
VSTDPPDLTEPHDPALDGLCRALTASGTAGEMAGRPAALEMFRTSRGRPPRFRSQRFRPQRFRPQRLRPHRLRVAVSMGSAAAALVLSGGIAAAYAAALPAPVQHIAYRMLGSIGVPDTHPPAPSANVPGRAPSVAPTPSASATAGRCPCPAGTSGTDTAPALILVAARTQVPPGGPDVLTGRLAPGGRPEAGVRVRLFEHVAGRPGWRAAGSAVTDASGTVTLAVPHLAGNAWFRLAVNSSGNSTGNSAGNSAGRGGAVSPPVLITVIPPVYLDLAPGPQPDVDVLTARAPSADTGDVVVLQERAGGVWYGVGQRVLGPDHRASFSVLVPSSGQVEYRVVMPRTTAHGSSVSAPVRIAARAGRAKTGGRARL